MDFWWSDGVLQEDLKWFGFPVRCYSHAGHAQSFLIPHFYFRLDVVSDRWVPLTASLCDKRYPAELRRNALHTERAFVSQDSRARPHDGSRTG